MEDFGAGIINYLRKPGFIHYDNSDEEDETPMPKKSMKMTSVVTPFPMKGK